jgi:23S rRNA (pseudouridine1915-N3)-methyltransferase
VRITLIAVGRLKEAFWRDAADEYLKRLGPYADVRVVEIADRDPGKGGEDRALALEAADVLKAVPAAAHVIALEIGGTQMSSERFSARLSQLGLDGRSNVAFVIGGSVGLAATVLARADERLSLGSMTLPHNLARIVLLEQVYRSFRIARGEPYHK